MRLRVEFHPSARNEFEVAYNWYRRRSEAVAQRFLLDVEQALERVSEEPNLGPPYINSCCRFVCRRFPFLIVYRVRGSALLVVAVAHGRRRPGYWRHR
jgi:toxin ParE1/3/4